MTEKNYHHGNLARALVKAARDLMERDGIKALTLRACAREAGVSHAAPSHHFANLDELLSAIASSGFEDFKAALDRGAKKKSDPKESLIAMGLAYVSFAEKNPALYRVMFGIERPNVRTEQLKETMDAAWEQLHSAVLSAGAKTDTDTSAMVVWSVVHGHAMLRAAQCISPEVDMDRVLLISLRTLTDSLR